MTLFITVLCSCPHHNEPIERTVPCHTVPSYTALSKHFINHKVQFSWYNFTIERLYNQSTFFKSAMFYSKL